MNRLIHSQAGFLRSLQMSQINFFAFVEGGLDRTFYDRILNQIFQNRGIRHRVISAKELPSKTGGKPSLLSFFKTMRRAGKLTTELFEKRSVSVFFADKDIDDVLKKLLRSDHLFYTPTYDLEGYLFSNGNLARAVADACGMTFDQASVFMGDQETWINRCVSNWREWTVLCMISHVYAVNCGCTFERPSAINGDTTLPTDQMELGKFRNLLREKLEFTELRFQAAFDLYDRKLTASIRAGAALRFFKGKWLKTILERQLRKSNVAVDANFNGAGERVTTTLVTQVGLTEECIFCEPYAPSLLKLTA